MKIQINARSGRVKGHMIDLHPDVTADAVVEACERRMHSLDDPGFCAACGFEQDGCEPDARMYQCESCGQFAVYGCEELLLYLA